MYNKNIENNFNFNKIEKKRKYPDSKVLSESAVALISVAQKYRKNLKKIEDEFNAIKKEETEIHNNFRRLLFQNQKRLKEFKNSELSRRETYTKEYLKSVEDLNKKYKNQLLDKTICKKCYNNVISKSTLCISCQEPVCKNCQDDNISWGCYHFSVNLNDTSQMDIDKNENNGIENSTVNNHDTHNNTLNEICCKDCISSLLVKRCEKCFKRLCSNKCHYICNICCNNNMKRNILLCDSCKDIVRQYQESLINNENKNIKTLKYTFINDSFLCYKCENPFCHINMCKSCTDKEGAICKKCNKVYCSHCQKKNKFIKIVMDSDSVLEKDKNSKLIDNINHSHWECINCLKNKKFRNSNSDNNKTKELKNEVQSNENDMNTDDINDINKINLREIEAKLNSRNHGKYFSRMMKLRPEIKAYQQQQESFNIKVKNKQNIDDKSANVTNNNMIVVNQETIPKKESEISEDKNRKDKILNNVKNSNENVEDKNRKDEILNSNVKNTNENVEDKNRKDEILNSNVKNANENIVIKPLEKALSNVSLE
ncbi:hypothetical protein BCR32DRAFT_267744 [Anaeromyces robustus]|uniref:Uncharacterized protein n=1 Tax=Anaeromyces robustus TaxID=1754192 RepID=A0A1Y1XA79_9FUNG|nr:hypothetical protein BCR32DRAFT_267744 [Anaeromyces robustus]|eukprot:ORX82254.1 hypothetical protein BCR32DRAFT_267744 [Anaeromyces robustus]